MAESSSRALTPRRLRDPGPLVSTPRVFRTVFIALLVFLGCFLGAVAGSLVRIPEIGTAVLFPPYAVLTAALLLTPARTWWLYVLAAMAGNYWPHHQGEGSVSFVLLAEVANTLRALVAATGVRLWSRHQLPFHTLRDMVVFLLFAGVLGPLVGAFVGAADVTIHNRLADFWLAWQAWLLSNTLTGLTLLPLILIVATQAGSWFTRTGTARRIEAALLLLGVLAVGYGLSSSSSIGSHPSSLYLLLPFLLWAAVRFGPGGTITALSAITALTIAGAMSGRGPFVAQSPAENLLELQVFVIAVSAPFLLLASLVHEHAETAAALRRSQAQFRSVVEDQTELICRFLPDGTYTFVNGAYCRYFGRTARELIGRQFLMFIPPGDPQASLEFLNQITPEHPQATREHQVLAPGGEVRWQQWTNRGLFDADGRLLEYQAVGRDITERKRAEEEHRLLEAQTRVEEALREADRRKDEFLAMLAHELRNPLAPIGMALEIMRREPPDSEQTAWARDVIGRQMGQMTRLVDDLMDVSRITRGKVRLVMGTVDLSEVVAQAVETSRPLIQARGQALRVSVPPTPLEVRGDRVRLSQVVANLLNNAAKYTNPGGHLELSVAPDGQRAILTVRDDGIGISPEMLPRVFDLFTQAEGARDGMQGGLGIGLTLVKRLVELHDGEVEARSDGLGRGSEFIVRLPVAPPSAGGPVTRWRVPHLHAAPLRILVVDDNIDAAESVARLLGLWGHAVLTVNDGLTAVDWATTFAPHAVLLDLGLPGLHGVEVARRLREKNVDQPLLIVAMTGFGQDQDRHRTAAAGFDYHFTKPVDIDVLQSLLAVHGQVIDQSRA